MSYPLVLELPEEIFLPLDEVARETGHKPEEIALQWLKAAARESVADPLTPFIGAFESGVNDLGTRHDEYLGRGLRTTSSPDQDEADGERQP